MAALGRGPRAQRPAGQHGRKAIRILAPMSFRDREDPGKGEDGEVRVLCKSVAVNAGFDGAM